MGENEKKKSSKILLLAFLLLIIFCFLGGYFLGASRKETSKESCKKEEKEEKKEEEPKEDVIPLKDRFVINSYGYELYFYIIDNGSLYYMYGDLSDSVRDIILTHSGCLSNNTGEYCKGNPEYSKEAVKIETLENVRRVKLFNAPGATDESFAVFAITEDGNVYMVNKEKASIYKDTKNVDDMIFKDDETITYILKKDNNQ